MIRRQAPTTKSYKTKADLEAQLSDEHKQSKSRRDAVKESISLVTLPLAGLAAFEQAKLPPGEVGSYTLDVLTIERHTDVLADAVIDIANHYPVLGVLLDRLAKTAPFGALIGVAMSLGVQIAENHKALPPHFRGMSPNLVDREDYVNHVKQEAMKRQTTEQMDDLLTKENANGEQIKETDNTAVWG